MDFIELHESLTDYFCRLEHGIEVARIRAASVVAIVKAHVEPLCAFGEICVHRDRGITLDCSPVEIAPLIEPLDT